MTGKLLVCIAVSIVSVLMVLGYATWPLFQTHEEMLADAMQQPTAEAFTEVLNQIFQNESLDSLVESDCATVFLTAYWRKYLSTNADSKYSFDDRDRAFSKFINTLSAECQLDPLPKWWVDDLKHFRFDPQEAFRSVPRNYSFARVAQGFEIFVEGKSFMVLTDGCEDAAILKAKPVSFVAPYGFDGPFKLFAYDPKSNKRGWTSDVWGRGRYINIDGAIPTQFVRIHKVNERVFVFGVSFDHAFVEGFDATSGRSVLRFSTTYSANPPH